MKHQLRTMQMAAVSIVFAVLVVPNVASQPTLTVGIGSVGLSFCLVGLEVDYNICNFDSDSTFQSLRLGTGVGFRLSENTSFTPLESRLVWFKGSSHLETTLGVLFQTFWDPPARESGFTFGKSVLSPTFYCAYRFEPPDGGFFFRIGLGGMYNFGDGEVFVQGVISYGISFE